MKWRVKVCLENYGREGVVMLTRKPFSRFYQDGIRVATLDLTADDADMQLAGARAKAVSMAAQISDFERGRF